MDDNRPSSARAMQALTPAITEEDAVKVLQNSMYPGARIESIKMVLAWCRATGRDPMKKPIHIVPMEVHDKATNRKAWRDVLMPGVGSYRSDAAATGQYAGIDEPEFGPMIVKDIDNCCEMEFPEWCRVTVKRMIGGQICCFTAREYWMENYASGTGGKGVNYMWRKRPMGQLAKCAEAQALRKAFPDETGNTNTQEEMEGKGFDGPVIEGQAHPAEPSTSREVAIKESGQAKSPPDKPFIDRARAALDAEGNGTKWLKLLGLIYADAQSMDEIGSLRTIDSFRAAMQKAPTLIKQQVDDMEKAAVARVTPQFDANQTSEGGETQQEESSTGTLVESEIAKAEERLKDDDKPVGKHVNIVEEAEKVAAALKADQPPADQEEDDGWPGPR